MAEELTPENPENPDETEEPIKQRKNGLYPGVSDELAESMKSGWADTELYDLAPIAQFDLQHWPTCRDSFVCSLAARVAAYELAARMQLSAPEVANLAALTQGRQAHHGAIVMDEFGNDPHGFKTGGHAQINACFGVSAAFEHAVGCGAQRENMPWPR